MNTSPHLNLLPGRLSRAFTLVELLVVIAIIGILAAFIVSGIAGASRRSKLNRIKTELKEVETAIGDYKAKLGFFPPDGPNPALPPLYYELVGVYQDAAAPQTFRSADDRDVITVPEIAGSFGVPAFANTADQRATVRMFLKDLSVSKTDLVPAPFNVQVLRPSVGIWTNGGTPRWSYNSRNPVHNPKSYDLWVDIVIGGQTNRIANWKTSR